MTEWELKQIHKNNVKLEKLQREYENVCGKTGISPMRSDGMPRGNSGKIGLEDVERKVDIENEYKILYRQNEKIICKARSYIETFPDEILRMIFTERYINGLDIVMIAADVGISMRQCEEICKVHFNNVF